MRGGLAEVSAGDELTVLHLFCGMGGGGLGFAQARPSWKGATGRYRTLGGVDVDPEACALFTELTGAPAYCLDLFTREQYNAYHGHEPPEDWKEILPADLIRIFGPTAPDVIFFSPPCKGFSALLPKGMAETAKYQALNELVFRGLWLCLEAWGKVPLLLMENVPRIRQRGADLLDQVRVMLRDRGYACTDRDHDAGALAGLAQSRVRFLLAARQRELCPAFVREPEEKPLKTLGEVLSALPLPGGPGAGPCHQLPRNWWLTLIRLALIEPGADWRYLKRIGAYELRLGDDGLYRMGAVIKGLQGAPDVFKAPPGWDEAAPIARWEEAEGALSEAWMAGNRYTTAYTVKPWGASAGTISTADGGATGATFVADPRPSSQLRRGNLKVQGWGEKGRTVTAGSVNSDGAQMVADPRPVATKFNHAYRLHTWGEPGGTVAGGAGPAQGAACVADPRVSSDRFATNTRVLDPSQPAPVVTCQTDIQTGALVVADPRLGCSPRTGAYGVRRWDDSCGTITTGTLDRDAVAVADPLGGWTPAVDKATFSLRRAPPQPCVIISPWGCWHRPLTDEELMVLQGFPMAETAAAMAELTSGSRRVHLGNAVPPGAATAAGEEFGAALLASRMGDTFSLTLRGIWVEQALAVS